MGLLNQFPMSRIAGTVRRVLAAIRACPSKAMGMAPSVTSSRQNMNSVDSYICHNVKVQTTI